jgi:hypothetical protein
MKNIALFVSPYLFFFQGEEVFNTYGELANWQLLHMYGFSEQHADNHYDAVRYYSSFFCIEWFYVVLCATEVILSCIRFSLI